VAENLADLEEDDTLPSEVVEGDDDQDDVEQ
jgi:hypothetical protein